MRDKLSWLLSLGATAAISSGVTWGVARNEVSSESVYLVGAVTITDPERLPEYQAVAGPLAAETGGYVPLAFSEPRSIEGEAPAPGLFFVERYDSLEGLQNFVNSPEFRQARTLRDEVADVHFMLAVDAYQH